MNVVSINPRNYLNIDKSSIESLPEEERKKNIQYEYLNEINDFKKYYDASKRKVITFHNDFYEIYLSVLKEVKNLLNGIGSTNEIELIAMISEIIWGGYLSKNNHFIYSESFMVKEEISTLFGANVVYGYGCCRNISAMLNDILNELGIKSYLVGIRNNNLSNGIFEITSVRKDDMGNTWNNFYSKFKKDKSSFEMNHAGVVFSYQGEYFIYDPTLIRFFRMKHFIGDEVFGEGNVVMQPSTLCLFDGFSYEEMRQYCNKFKEASDEISNMNIVRRFYKGSEMINENITLCNDFHKRVKPELRELDAYRKEILLKRR